VAGDVADIGWWQTELADCFSAKRLTELWKNAVQQREFATTCPQDNMSPTTAGFCSRICFLDVWHHRTDKRLCSVTAKSEEILDVLATLCMAVSLVVVETWVWNATAHSVFENVQNWIHDGRLCARLISVATAGPGSVAWRWAAAVHRSRGYLGLPAVHCC